MALALSLLTRGLAAASAGRLPTRGLAAGAAAPAGPLVPSLLTRGLGGTPAGRLLTRGLGSGPAATLRLVPTLVRSLPLRSPSRALVASAPDPKRGAATIATVAL
jgi:hypothetical protein